MGLGRTRTACSQHSTLGSHSAGLVGHQLTSPDGSSGGGGGGCGSPSATWPVGASPRAHHRGRVCSCTHCFSKLIPHARLMNNVIKGAITLFLNAF